MKFRATSAAALLTGVALVSTACGAPQSPSDSDDGVMRSNTTAPAAGPLDSATWMIAQEPPTMDLDKDTSISHHKLILANVCERLMQVSPDLSVSPYLASDVEWPSDHQLVLTLRDDVTFHDGSPMTAEDVAWSLERHMTPGAAEADEYVNVRGVEVTGEHEVTIDMKQRDAVFVESLAGDAGVIQSRALVEQQGDDFGTPAGHDACSGPFTLDEWRPGTRVVLTRYQEFWNTERAARTDQLIIRWGDDDAIVNALLTGEADGAYLENQASAARFVGDDSMNVAQGESTRAWSLIATERGGLTDPRIRQALSLVIDRQGLNDAAFSGLGRPWNEPVGPGAWGFQRQKFEAANEELELSPLQLTDENLQRAKSLVAEVGDTSEIVVATDGEPIRSALAEAVVTAAEKIGLTASITRIPTAQYSAFYSDPDIRQKADLFSDNYFISKYDPVGFYKNGASNSAVQYVFEDSEYDQLVQAGRAATDDAERAGIAIDLARRWQHAMPWISTTAVPNTVVYADDVTGIPAAGIVHYYPWAADLGAAD